MKHLRQPNNMTCGQTSFAMVTGMTPHEAINFYGHDHATKFHEHVTMLKRKGYDVTGFVKVDNRKKYDLPNTCMVRLCKSGKKTGHLVVHHKGKFYDPARDNGIFDSREELLKRYPKGWRIEYYLEVKGKNNKVENNPQEEMLAEVAGETKFRVRVSHDIYNTGKKHYITKIVTEEGLRKLQKQDTFKIEVFERV